MRDRFVFDSKENILFINFADLRIESREQVDEFARMVREAVEEHCSSEWNASGVGG